MDSIGIALATVAQLAVVIPGFAALVTALRRGEQGLRASERIGFMLMLCMASITVVGALLPFVLYPVTGEHTTWRVCSPLLGLALGITAAVIAWLRHTKSGTETGPRKPGLLLWTGIVPFSVFSFLLVLGAAWPHPSLYLAGLLVTLFGAGYQFWMMIRLHDHRLPTQDQLRRAAEMVLDTGRTVREVSRATGIHRKALRRWVNLLREEQDAARPADSGCVGV